MIVRQDVEIVFCDNGIRYRMQPNTFRDTSQYHMLRCCIACSEAGPGNLVRQFCDYVGGPEHASNGPLLQDSLAYPNMLA
jgi:hypothetical protein